MKAGQVDLLAGIDWLVGGGYLLGGHGEGRVVGSRYLKIDQLLVSECCSRASRRWREAIHVVHDGGFGGRVRSKDHLEGMEASLC